MSEDNLGMFADKFFKILMGNVLPAPLGTLIQTIDECKSENELAEKFDEIKKLVSEIGNSIPSIPISIENEYASIAIVYFHKTEYTQNFPEKEEEEDLKSAISHGFEENDISMANISVSKNYLLLQEIEPIEKTTWTDEIIPIVRKVLLEYYEKEDEEDDKYEIKIRAIAYA